MSETVEVVPQHVLHWTLGPFLLGTWINVALFSFEVTQVYRYFAASPLFQCATTNEAGRRSDPMWIRIVVVWMFVLDIISSGVGCALAYTVCLIFLARATTPV